MRFIKLDYKEKEIELFNTTLNLLEYDFYYTHRDAFRQMFKEQGKDFWLRYLLTYRSHSATFGFIGRLTIFQDHLPEFQDMVDWVFINLHNRFVDGSISDVRQLMDDVCFCVHNRHLIGKIGSTKCVKDPFYITATRDTFRRLFGNPQDVSSYKRVQVVLPIYEVFTGSLCVCLRQWIDSPDMLPDDQSYWVPPSDDDPPLGMKSESFGIDLAYAMEKRLGCPAGPMFMHKWTPLKDPRFHDPSNPLYNTSAKKGSDWRDGIDESKFSEFFKYCRDLKKDDTAMGREGKSAATCSCKPHPDERKTKTLKSDSSSPSKPTTKEGASHDQLQADLAKSIEEIAKNTLGFTAATDFSSVKSQEKLSKPLKSTPVPSKGSDKSAVSETISVRIGLLNGVGDSKSDVNANGKLKTGSKEKDSSKSGVNSCKISFKAEVNDKSQLNVVATGGNSLKTDDYNAITGSIVQVDAKVKVNKERKLVDKQKTLLASSLENEDATSKCRCCASCSKLESRPHEFKKCKRCKDDGLKIAKYYCGRDCQVSDWNKVHRLEHREVKLASSTVPLTSLTACSFSNIAAID